jgi:hypothetical protein
MPHKLSAVVLATCVLLAATAAFALQSGDTVVFLIPSDANQPDPPSGPADKLIFTGGRVTTVDVTGCGAGSHPVQNAVLVDPTGGRPGRIIGVIVLSESEPVRPGTKVVALSLQGTCTIGTTSYNRYEAFVE